MISVPVEVDAQTGGGGDAGDDADRALCSSQYLALLDVDFKEGLEGSCVGGIVDFLRIEAAIFQYIVERAPSTSLRRCSSVTLSLPHMARLPKVAALKRLDSSHMKRTASKG